VSTRATTIVEILAGPTAVAVYDSRPGSPRFAFGLAPQRRLEVPQPLLAVGGGWRCAWHQDTDDVPSRLPLNLVTGPDSVPVCKGLGQSDLELARDFGHDSLL